MTCRLDQGPRHVKPMALGEQPNKATGGAFQDYGLIRTFIDRSGHFMCKTFMTPLTHQ